MEADQKRVVEEQEELSRKISGLQLFLRTRQFDTLPVTEQSRWMRRLKIMREYRAVLAEIAVAERQTFTNAIIEVIYPHPQWLDLTNLVNWRLDLTVCRDDLLSSQFEPAFAELVRQAMKKTQELTSSDTR